MVGDRPLLKRKLTESPDTVPIVFLSPRVVHWKVRGSASGVITRLCDSLGGSAYHILRPLGKGPRPTSLMIPLTLVDKV